MSDTGKPPSRKFTKRRGHLRDENFLELDDTRYSWDSDSGSVRTVIQEDGAAPSILEDAILRKPVPIYQPMRR